MDEMDSETSYAEDDDPTSMIKVRAAKAMLEDITAKHRSQPKAPSAGWLQRFLNWFRRDQSPS